MPERMSINTAELQSDLVEVCDTLNTLRAISANASERRSGGDKLTYSAAQVCDLTVLLLETICAKLNRVIEALDAIDATSPEPITQAVQVPAKQPAKPRKNYVPMQKYVPINQDNRTEVK